MFVADVGNSRLKWGRLKPDGSLAEMVAFRSDDSSQWLETFTRWHDGEGADRWAIASVNPPIAERLGAFLAERGVRDIRWFRSAADVAVRHTLAAPAQTGADRALAVVAATAREEAKGPGLVISCGTAITVERIGPDGTWEGGAIAVGLHAAARALNETTAQLPIITLENLPEAWGNATASAIAAGIFWGAVGTVRELISRQSETFSSSPWIVWTGGDAATLAPWVSGPVTCLLPDLVLLGLARAAFSGALSDSP